MLFVSACDDSRVHKGSVANEKDAHTKDECEDITDKIQDRMMEIWFHTGWVIEKYTLRWHIQK